MKKSCLAALALALILGLTACSETEKKQEDVELHVFAAASLTETLTELGARYGAEHPGVTVVFTFDSSGTLQTQIEEGAICDLFLSAAQAQMDALAGGGYVDEATRVDLLENQVVLAVPEGNSAGLKDFADLSGENVSLVALGNADVPVGQYARELLTALDLWETVEKKATFGSNVKEVTTWVAEGTVDCGIIYATDASAAGLEVVAVADPALLSGPVTYPAAVLAGAEHPAEAKAFLDYLQSEESAALFEQAGFALPNK